MDSWEDWLAPTEWHLRGHRVRVRGGEFGARHLEGSSPKARQRLRKALRWVEKTLIGAVLVAWWLLGIIARGHLTDSLNF